MVLIFHKKTSNGNIFAADTYFNDNKISFIWDKLINDSLHVASLFDFDGVIVSILYNLESAL